MPSKTPKLRVLSLDGGGTWALVQVRALGALYGDDTPGHEILDDFDLVAANSGGTLVLAGLACNWSPRILRDTLTPALLSHLYTFTWYGRLTRRLGMGARYSTAGKLATLQQRLVRVDDEGRPRPDQGGRSSLAQVASWGRPEGDPRRLMFMGFDYATRRGLFMRSFPTQAGSTTGDGIGEHHHKPPTEMTLAEAVNISANAPVNYFDKPAVTWPSGRRGAGWGVTNAVRPWLGWDGAMGGFNNPALAALVEALADGEHRGVDPWTQLRRTRMLSLGTGRIWRPVVSPGEDIPKGVDPALVRQVSTGWLEQMQEASGAIMIEPPTAATYTAYTMLGGKHRAPLGAKARLVRMSPLLMPLDEPGAGWSFPDLVPGDPSASKTAFEALTELDMDVRTQANLDLLETFIDAWLDDRIPNEPIRMNREGKAELGHTTFGEAKAAWEKGYP